MKFNPGDLVWARAVPNSSLGITPGEYAGVILQADVPHPPILPGIYYTIDIPELPARRFHPIALADYWYISERYLRPRRDDYQQHDGVGSQEALDNLLRAANPVSNFSNELQSSEPLTEASIEKMLEHIRKQIFP